MGSFYTNFLALGASSDAALAALRGLKRRGYVVNAIRGVVTIYDAQCDEQDKQEIEYLGGQLSTKLQAPVLGILNHDDSHLLLWQFRSGACVRRYSSFLHGPAFAASLSRARGGFLYFPIVAGVLSWPVVIFQTLRHLALTWVLDLPPCSVGAGYRYIERGEIPHSLTREDLIAI